MILYGGYRWAFPPTSPTGATLSIVDGTPITANDLAAEAQSAELSTRNMDAKTRRQLLDRIVDRRLLVAAAKRGGIEGSPIYQASVARAGEMVAAGAIARHLTGNAPAASEEAVRRYIAAHPLQFGQRQRLVTDSVAAVLPETLRQRIAGADSIDEVASLLKGAGVPFERQQRPLDTATLPPELAGKMIAAKPGELFQLPLGDRALILAVTAREPVAMAPAEQLAAARQALARSEQDDDLKAALAALRRKAKIEYQ